MKLKITERGWPAHLIVCQDCIFRRNTLLEYGRKKIVVSTVGNYRPFSDRGNIDTIGHARYFETRVFKAKFEKGYWEANIDKSIYFNSPWCIDHCEHMADQEANDMHEKVVKEISKKMKQQP